VMARFESALRGEEDYAVEFRTNPTAAGDFRWIYAVGNVERDAGGKPVRFREWPWTSPSASKLKKTYAPPRHNLRRRSKPAAWAHGEGIFRPDAYGWTMRHEIFGVVA